MWSSASIPLATVDSFTGIVTGVSAGAARISYTLPTGCAAEVTMNVLPAPAGITGPSTECVGLSDTLSDTTAGGGLWSTSIFGSGATIGSVSGVVTGVFPGIETIVFTSLASGCTASTTITVNTAPSGIMGADTLCVGATTALTDAVSGGVWSSSNPAVGTVSATGIVTGITGGTSIITYSVSGGCYVTQAVSVRLNPAAIGGPSGVYVGAGIALTDVTVPGTWSSSSGLVSVGSLSGFVTGLAGGVATITYTTSTGCTATKTITVNTCPTAILGSLLVCAGSGTTLSDAVPGGTWSSGTTTIATIGSTGVVTTHAAGTSVIFYTLGTGCSATATLTVNPLPGPIAGPLNVCAGSSVTLTDIPTGGTWSASGTSATIGATTGAVSGTGAGTEGITYTAGGCSQSATVTVNPLPAVIGGLSSVCSGQTISLSETSGGGVWSSGSTGIATIGSSTGTVTGGPGTGAVTISYTFPTGCATTRIISVNGLPAGIGGPGTVCPGASITLSDLTGGGTWSTGSTGITLGSTGTVTGVSTGATATVTYTSGLGCYVTRVVTVSPLPVISGPTAVCAGATITEVSGTGGTWSSSIPAIAGIGSSTGIVTGIATGTTVITYLAATGCMANATVTVSTAPSLITGASAVCTGTTTTLTDGVPGGVWSSSSGSATIGSLTGVVSGVTTGGTTISYSLGTGCTVSRAMTVVASPAAITGITSLCTGTSATLTDGTTGGHWSSGATGVATIGSSTGTVSGLSAGTSAITYTLSSTGCTAAAIVTVNTTPAAISGPAAVCTGATVTESDTTAGGTWSSTASTISIGSATGIVTGVAGGGATITYAIGSCAATRTMSVNAISPISGASGLCAGTSTTLTDGTAGGTWSSGTITVATVGSASGAVSGLTYGTTIISYTAPSGCIATKAVTVNSGPSAISGTAQVCLDMTDTLSDAISGGTWTSGAPAVATVGSATGIVTGVSTGAATITYSLGTGCIATKPLTVNTLPLAISGASNMCAGATTTLADGSPGGSWSSGSTAIATIGSASGIVSGIGAGTTTITYRVASGCVATKLFTVNPVPAAISGITSVCTGATTTLGTTSTGGVWSSSATTTATVGSTGIVSGIAAGTAIITYAFPTGCYTTKGMTVNPLPSAISGTAAMCIGSSTTLSDVVLGGTWSSGTTSIAIVGSLSGVVTGLAAGTAVISYSPGTGCGITRTVTVNPLPSAISGTTSAGCAGTTMTLTDATGGGTWSSSNPAVAGVGTGTGLVTGVSSGTAIITYTTAAGCIATTWITINALPPSITGSANVCAGSTVTLSDPASGGTWSSGSPGIATVGSLTGVVSGVSGGTAIISYMASTGCAATRAVTVTAVPAITGLANICAWGDTLMVNDANSTGAYTSSLVTISNLGGGAGKVFAHAPGTATISYTLPLGCTTTATITINPLPDVITGIMSLCAGAATTLSNASAGGAWSSGAPTIATAGSATGIVGGITPGTAYITYTLTTGCKTDTPVHVNPSPAMIVGFPTMVVSTTTTYTDASTGGIWSSSNPTIANIGAGTGIIHGLAVGVVTISYTSATGCYSTKALTVNPLSPTGPGDGTAGNVAITGSNIRVTPNPNRGEFTIAGTLDDGMKPEEDVRLEVTDMLGQVVYRANILAHYGRIEEQVSIGDSWANGMYLVSLKSEGDVKVVHVVVNR